MIANLVENGRVMNKISMHRPRHGWNTTKSPKIKRTNREYVPVGTILPCGTTQSYTRFVRFIFGDFVACHLRIIGLCSDGFVLLWYVYEPIGFAAIYFIYLYTVDAKDFTIFLVQMQKIKQSYFFQKKVGRYWPEFMNQPIVFNDMVVHLISESIKVSKHDINFALCNILYVICNYCSFV